MLLLLSILVIFKDTVSLGSSTLLFSLWLPVHCGHITWRLGPLPSLPCNVRFCFLFWCLHPSSPGSPCEQGDYWEDFSCQQKVSPCFLDPPNSPTLASIPSRPKENLWLQTVLFPALSSFCAVARVVFPEQRPDEVPLLGEKPRKIPIAGFLGPGFKVLLLYDHRLPNQPHRLLCFFLFISAWHFLHMLKPCPPPRDCPVTFHLPLW